MGPLSGYKIVELKGIGPGPYAGMLLADLGAEVVVVERLPATVGLAPPASADLFSRGKKSVALDLKSTQGRDVLLKLVENADAIFEGFRPGVVERLGIGPDECLARNRKLVYGRITGWGQSGPLSHSAGHDINYISLTGVLDAIGSGDKPVPPLNLVGDFSGGSLFLVAGMLAAMLEAQKSGEGQVVDAAITDGSAHLMTLFYTLSNLGVWTPQRASNMLDGGTPFYGVYETADARYVSVGALEPKFFAELIQRLELPESMINEQNNPARWSELKSALTHAFKGKTRDEWADLFAGSDACVTPVLNYEEAIDHPHNSARQSYFKVDGVNQPAPAPKFSRSKCAPPHVPHAEGADTNEVLETWGFATEDIERLTKAGVLGG